MGSTPASGRSLAVGNGYLLQYFLPGKPHGQRSLVGCSPWGHEESDMVEHESRAHWVNVGYKDWAERWRWVVEEKFFPRV